MYHKSNVSMNLLLKLFQTTYIFKIHSSLSFLFVYKKCKFNYICDFHNVLIVLFNAYLTPATIYYISLVFEIIDCIINVQPH